MRSIPRLVGDPRTLEAAWEREPFVGTSLPGFDDVFCVAEAQRMLQRGVPAAAVRLFRAGQKLPPRRVQRPVDPNFRARVLLADFDKVAAAMAEGYTLVLDEVQAYSPSVRGFASALAAETGYETDCTAFLTPPHAQGAAPHIDAASVFLRQVYGAKRWRLSVPVQRRPGGWRPGDEARTVLDVWLEAGQSLYIPRGFVHVGETGELPSVHLATSLYAPSWGSVLAAALNTAVSTAEDLDEPVPPVFASADCERLLKERVGTLTAHLDQLKWSDVAPLRPAPGTEPAPGALSAVLETVPPDAARVR